MKTVTIPSKMNFSVFDERNKRNYREAMEYLSLMPLDSWVRTDQIPNHLKYAVIDILDCGYKPHVYTALNERGDLFLLTKGNVYNSMIEARVIDLKNMKGIKYCPSCKNYKSIYLFSASSTNSDGLNGFCKRCYQISRTKKRLIL